MLHKTSELHAALSAAYDALEAMVVKAESWHKIHAGTDIHCDDLCACIPTGRAALDAARPLIEEGVHA